MAVIKDVYAFLDRLAPFRTQMAFDNAGLLVGKENQAVTKILVALDITENVATEASNWGAQLIVSHHPVIFQPVKSITDADPVGRRLLALAENNIAAICAHTNLDAAQGGVNDVLARALGLSEISLLEPSGTDEDEIPYGIGRVGVLLEKEPVTAGAFALRVKKTLGAADVRYVDNGTPVRKVAVGGGACGDMYTLALALGCDTFITSDVKYHDFLDAKSAGISLMDAGHFATENVICPVLVQALRKEFPALEISQSRCHTEVYSAL